MTDDMMMPDFEPNILRTHVQQVMKRTVFLDIETCLLQFYGFRTGMQRPGIQNLVGDSQTKLLTTAWGSWWDLHHQGAAGVKSVGNHHRKGAFKKDPLDDTYVLRKIWKVLDDADIVVAHNAAFDLGWLNGRFMDLGMKLPSKVYAYCTYRTLSGLNGVSKKLDYLSQKLCGTSKIEHEGLPLWIGCSEGKVEAFEKMEDYNIGDIHDTLYEVYKRTALYANRTRCIDLRGAGLFCQVTGDPLTQLDELHTNRTTGLQYYLYTNEKYGIDYRCRYNITAKKAGQGYIQPLVTNRLTNHYGG